MVRGSYLGVQVPVVNVLVVQIDHSSADVTGQVHLLPPAQGRILPDEELLQTAAVHILTRQKHPVTHSAATPPRRGSSPHTNAQNKAGPQTRTVTATHEIFTTVTLRLVLCTTWRTRAAVSSRDSEHGRDGETAVRFWMCVQEIEDTDVDSI
ncbi:hypothetical protein EYF80_055043 [Liparis tanakae]|uniref:Uncharacterized protein n=1 Tax=Liparis tanakae TaxID=230148 RepID=A0A4Z2F0Q6_9TELE|nr:hypothetical protein EYF80_055043 [Liparis tanakae]